MVVADRTRQHNGAGQGPQLPYETGYLRCADIGIDMSYQRALSKARASWLAKNWDAVIAGAIRVNRRPDNSDWAVDGQHRLIAAQQAGEEEILADIYHLDPAREPALFAAWNSHGANAQPREVFRARLAAGDPKAQVIQNLVETCGYEIDVRRFAKGDDAHMIGCVRTLEQLYDDYQPFSAYIRKRPTGARNRGGDRGPRPERLVAALRLLRMTWGGQVGGTSEVLIRACDRIMERHGGEIDLKNFGLKVGGMEPRLLARRAGEQSKLYHKSSDTLCYEEMLRVYNSGKRVNRIRLPGEELD